MRFWSPLLFLCIGLVFGQAPAYAWTLQDTDGNTLNQESFHGRWLQINFWAPWYQPCRQAIQGLVRPLSMMLPTSFLYAPDGKLVQRLEGSQTESSIKQAMVAANY